MRNLGNSIREYTTKDLLAKLGLSIALVIFVVGFLFLYMDGYDRPVVLDPDQEVPEVIVIPDVATSLPTTSSTGTTVRPRSTTATTSRVPNTTTPVPSPGTVPPTTIVCCVETDTYACVPLTLPSLPYITVPDASTPERICIRD